MMNSIATTVYMSASNRLGEPLECREIKTTEYISTPTDMATTKTTTTTVEEVPASNKYVVKQADVFTPLAVISETTPGKIVGDMEPIFAEHHTATVAEPAAKKVIKTETVETKK